MCDIGVKHKQFSDITLNRIKEIDKKLHEVEITSAKIKAVNFVNMQSFDDVYDNYVLGEVYKVDEIGYTVITSKTPTEITFVIIMNLDQVWYKHWQDVDKILNIKQGVYYDMFTGNEYKDSVEVKAFEPSYFKAVGDEDLIMKGKIFR